MTSDQDHKQDTGDQKNTFPWKLVILGVLMVLIAAGYYLFADKLSLDYLAQREAALREFHSRYPILIYLLAFAIYVAVTGLSIPGATALTLLYAWVFGFWPALVLVSFASTSGAMLAFLLSRYLLRDSIQRRFGERLKAFNEALDREGAFYLFTLRLIPAVPFFVINVVMGLTSIRATTFWWVSQLGMLAGTCVYVYAGASIPNLEQLADPSQLRGADLLAPRQLAEKLAADSDSVIGRRVREALDADARQWIDHLAQSGGELSSTQAAKFASILNDALTRPATSLQSPWQQLYRPRDDMSAEERRSREKELTSINRQLLVRAFPQEVRPPQPIIGAQLLIAFSLLGLFPIVAKRAIHRLRPNRGNSNGESEETNGSTNST